MSRAVILFGSEAGFVSTEYLEYSPGEWSIFEGYPKIVYVYPLSKQLPLIVISLLKSGETVGNVGNVIGSMLNWQVGVCA